MVFCFVCTLEITHSPVLELDCAQRWKLSLI
jgi:hypothetical protein